MSVPLLQNLGWFSRLVSKQEPSFLCHRTYHALFETHLSLSPIPLKGPMGAGKSYTMRKLVDKGRFPLLAFVNVDPDEIRRQLPEYHLYVSQNAELAGELTRKEAGLICT